MFLGTLKRHKVEDTGIGVCLPNLLVAHLAAKLKSLNFDVVKSVVSRSDEISRDFRFRPNEDDLDFMNIDIL